MSDLAIKAAIRTTALIAFKHVDQLSDAEIEAVLITLVEAGEHKEAEVAASGLYHRIEARKAQLILKGVIAGEGAT